MGRGEVSYISHANGVFIKTPTSNYMKYQVSTVSPGLNILTDNVTFEASRQIPVSNENRVKNRLMRMYKRIA